MAVVLAYVCNVMVLVIQAVLRKQLKIVKIGIVEIARIVMTAAMINTYKEIYDYLYVLIDKKLYDEALTAIDIFIKNQPQYTASLMHFKIKVYRCIKDNKNYIKQMDYCINNYANVYVLCLKLNYLLLNGKYTCNDIKKIITDIDNLSTK